MATPIPHRVTEFANPSVWLEFSPLASALKAHNLGQGFPSWGPPKFVNDAAAKAVTDERYSQYARSAGHFPLVEQLAEAYESHLQRQINPLTNVVVTAGASEAIYLAFLSLMEPNDEAILFTPAFDLYAGALAMIGGKAVHVPLKTNPQVKDSSCFSIDLDELEAKITPRTRVLVLNTPHNPTGKVFTRSELVALGKVLEKHPQVTVVSDEVYEHIVFEDNEHVSMASIPEMFPRTLTISSAGKTFSITGWKIGWVVGPEDLIQRLQICQQWVIFSIATPLQAALAEILVQAQKPFDGYSSYYEWLKHSYASKRQLLITSLKEAGFDTISPAGSFFVLADISEREDHTSPPNGYLDFCKSKGIALDTTTLQRRDYNFCRQLGMDRKVVAIPNSAFYHRDHYQNGENFIRFAFCKDESILENAGKNLANH